MTFTSFMAWIVLTLEWTFILFLSWTPFFIAAQENGTTENQTMSDLIDRVFLGYDQKLPPKHNIPIVEGFEQQVDVKVTLYIISIFDVSERNMDYSMSVFLRQRWIDPRLAYNNTLNVSRLVLDRTLFQKVWVPDLYILNEKKSEFHDVTVLNQYMHIYPDGTVQLSMRVTGIFNCAMKLHKYPFDSQECGFEVESYGHSTEVLRFRWADTPLTIADNIELPQFYLTNSYAYSCEKTYFDIKYPCVGLKLLLQRNYAYHITQVYIPSGLIVLLSWVNFWLDQNAVPARITLALLTVLTLTTQSEGARANLPRVSYIKAIDVWMTMCLSFVFLALIEFALVNVQSRKGNRHRKSQSSDTCTTCTRLSSSNESFNNLSSADSEPSRPIDERPCIAPCIAIKLPSEMARRTDKVSRLLFPFAFLLFNIFYWLFYFHWIHVEL